MRVTSKSGLHGARRFLNASDEGVPEASYRDLADLAGVCWPHCMPSRDDGVRSKQCTQYCDSGKAAAQHRLPKEIANQTRRV
jgi:hypothetical protein